MTEEQKEAKKKRDREYQAKRRAAKKGKAAPPVQATVTTPADEAEERELKEHKEFLAKTPDLVDARNSRLEARLRRLVKAAGHPSLGRGPLASIRIFARDLGLEADIPPRRKEQEAFEAAIRQAGRW